MQPGPAELQPLESSWYQEATACAKPDTLITTPRRRPSFRDNPTSLMHSDWLSRPRRAPSEVFPPVQLTEHSVECILFKSSYRAHAALLIYTTTSVGKLKKQQLERVGQPVLSRGSRGNAPRGHALFMAAQRVSLCRSQEKPHKMSISFHLNPWCWRRRHVNGKIKRDVCG
ncbi:hypothetical protein NDU88_000594 [Pleurodeles waltl]|uniref:Uncharacterized protein n=1 Tax=Pleurodeles waltl TaxID=8319 RepID=A0AAV7N8C3_PLEWA|nr:hypothetical protein NDU88_000594 [Pleurodeles waltl]